MYLGAVSACPKIKILGKIENRKNTGFWPSPAPGDLIWVTLGQETYCKEEEMELLDRVVRQMESVFKTVHPEGYTSVRNIL